MKDDESESEAKTDSGHRVCLLSVVCLYLAWVEHAQHPLLARAHTNKHTHTDITSPPRVDPNFLTHFTDKGGPSIFQWSTLSM